MRFIVDALALPSCLQGPLALNVIGGVLAAVVYAGLVWVLQLLRERIERRRFRRVFGGDSVGGSMQLVYSAISLRPDALNPSIQAPEFAFCKRSRQGYVMRVPDVIPECDGRATSYLAACFGRNAGLTPQIASDALIQSKLDLSFVSIGFGSNDKTVDLFSNESSLVKYVEGAALDSLLVVKATGKPLLSFEPGYTYGVIAKVRPKQFPVRCWLCCAGIDEWGTSAASWFLANKWDQLRAHKLPSGKHVDDQPFVAVIRARRGQDESAERVKVVA